MRKLLLISAVYLVSASIWPLCAFGGDWKPLFDGKDLSRWKAMGENANAWKIENGVLRVLEKGDWLSTLEEFSDFDLELDFRLVSKGANSGVFIRAPHEGYPAYTGLEIQLLDDEAPEHRDLKPYQYTGSVYGIAAPSSKASKGIGEWQRLQIGCRGPNIKVALNDTEIVKVNLEKHVNQKDKFPGVLRRKGHIGLQSYGNPGEVQFRNIRVRTISEQ